MNAKILIVLTASLSVLGGCERTPTGSPAQLGKEPAAPSTRLVSIPTSLTGFETCSNVTAKTVVRIAIPANLSNIVTTKRLVRYSSVATTGDDEEIFDNRRKSTVEPGDAKDAEYQDNAFHLTVANVPPVTGETHLQVRVILRNPNFKFLSRPGRINQIQGVAYEDGMPGAGWLCQLADPISTLPAVPASGGSDAKPARQVLTFFVKRGGGETAAINFLIGANKGGGATGGEETPILIDPKIKNNG